MTSKRTGPETWEQTIDRELSALSDLSQEEPPSVAALQLLVSQVQREGRQQTARDLLLFWLCAAAVLGGLLYALGQVPLIFLALQGAAVTVGLACAVIWSDERKRVSP